MASMVFQAGTLSVIGLDKGWKLFVMHILPEDIEDYAEIEETKDGNTLLTMKCDCVLVVENLHENGLTCMHVRFIRENRRRPGLTFARPRKFPRLRAALKHDGRINSHAPGGFDRYVVIYADDEIAVADYAQMGSHGFIVARNEIAGLLTALPPLKVQAA